MEVTLVGDIGGTNSRFALAHAGGPIESIRTIHNDTVPDLEAAIENYLSEVGARPRAATIAIAGPVDSDEIALTNRTWRFRRADFAERFGFTSFRVINDFEAVAWALTQLRPDQTRRLGPAMPRRDGVKVVLGPGTGLGVAGLLPIGAGWHVLASEGGHVSFGPQARDEFAVFARLHKECAELSAEMVLSGPGLVRLARTLDPANSDPEPEAILAAARADEGPARSTAQLFIRLLGRFAGGLALTFKALGGVYIAGGVSHGLAPLMNEAQFRAAFEAHPPHEAMLKNIATLLVTAEEPGLLGCAAFSELNAADRTSA
jgi:glucokinase